MILDISEQEYRRLPQTNYTKVKTFDTNPRLYHRKYILGESVEDENDAQEKQHFRHGNLIDTLLTKEEEFDYLFYITDAKEPTGQLGTFTSSLYKHTLLHMDKEGILGVELDYLYQIAFDEVGAKKGSVESFKEKFVKEGGFDYYMDLRKRGTRTVVTQKEYEQACYLVEKLKNNPVSAGLINKVSDDRYNVIHQLVCTGIIDDIEVKIMVDKVIVDEEKKIVHGYDYKTTANGSMFPYNWLKLSYYLQFGLYTEVLRQNYPDYEVKPLGFAAFDKSLYNDPIIYVPTQDNLRQALNGFKLRGRIYNGLYTVIQNLKYAQANDCWRTTVEAHKAGGRLPIELFEDL